ncbi:MAG: DUF1501 domain-containing protein [Limisphaerales bacterium]
MASPLNLNRRSFLVASTAGVAGFRFGNTAGAANIPPSARSRPAKTTILFFLCGGASHIDTFDMKPDAPSEYRGPFAPIRTSAPDIQVCEHLPMTAKVAKHFSIVRSVSDHGRATGDHHAGYYYNLTGHAPDLTFRTQGNNRRPYPDDWPFMGSVIASRRPAHPKLPPIMTLPHKPSRAPYTRPGQFAGKLGLAHDPFYLYGNDLKPMQFSAPSLSLEAGVDQKRLDTRQGLLAAVNEARREFDHEVEISNYTAQQGKAFDLLSSSVSASAFDLESEPEKVRERYGKSLNGMSLLMARRLAEAGLPFITVFWKENTKLNKKCRSAGGWDTHGNNFACLKENLLPEFDRAYSALIEDLAQRDMLNDTLVLVNSEMGRKPKIGDPRSGGVTGAGRDHWTACQSILLAGGGIQGGRTFGTTDKFAEYPAENPLSPTDITSTVYHAMGVNDLTATDALGRPFNLIEDGRVLTELF